MVGSRIPLDRRSFLFGRLSGSVSPPAQPEPGRYLRQINAVLCIGCDVCINICSQDAICLVEREGEVFYVVNPDRCDGCGLCAELCESGATDMKACSGGSQPQLIALAAGQCAACGAQFHIPRKGGGQVLLCRVCISRQRDESHKQAR